MEVGLAGIPRRVLAGAGAAFGPPPRAEEPLTDRHRDIARSVQTIYEEAFFHLITPLARSSGLIDIALAGGCAMNSVANGKIRRTTLFRRVYVQAAAGDAGGAIGAAFALWHREGGIRTFVMDHAYWRPQFSPDAVAELLAAQRGEISAANCRIEELPDEAELCRRTATAIADGIGIVAAINRRERTGTRTSIKPLREFPDSLIPSNLGSNGPSPPTIATAPPSSLRRRLSTRLRCGLNAQICACGAGKQMCSLISSSRSGLRRSPERAARNETRTVRLEVRRSIQARQTHANQRDQSGD